MLKNHVPSGFLYHVVGSLENHQRFIYGCENASKIFCENIIKIAYDYFNKNIEPIDLITENINDLNHVKICYLCNKKFSKSLITDEYKMIRDNCLIAGDGINIVNDIPPLLCNRITKQKCTKCNKSGLYKVKDHDHYNGQYLGCAH